MYVEPFTLTLLLVSAVYSIVHTVHTWASTPQAPRPTRPREPRTAEWWLARLLLPGIVVFTVALLLFPG